jgi:hypothetical protein
MKTKIISTSALCLLAASFPAYCVPAVKAKATAPPQQVALRASLDQTRFTPGQPIAVNLTATNTSRRDAVLRFSSGQRFDFSVFKVGQRESVYTWSATRMFLQSTASLRLRPGQGRQLEASIGDEVGQLGPGKYRLLARLSNSPRPIAAPPITFEIVDLGLSIVGRTDKTSYKIGEPVRIDVAVANRLSRVNTVPFSSGLTFDVFITDEEGKPVWNYSANLRFIQALKSVTWEASETKNFSAEWNGVALPSEIPAPALKPGRYRVQAMLASTPQLLAAPVEIEITN